MVSLFYWKNNELTSGNQWSFFHLIHKDLVWEYLRPKSRTWSRISSTSRWVLFKMLRGEFWITFSSPACNGGGLYWNKSSQSPRILCVDKGPMCWTFARICNQVLSIVTCDAHISRSDSLISQFGIYIWTIHYAAFRLLHCSSWKGPGGVESTRKLC